MLWSTEEEMRRTRTYLMSAGEVAGGGEGDRGRRMEETWSDGSCMVSTDFLQHRVWSEILFPPHGAQILFDAFEQKTFTVSV
eukprot:765390-Hanusia_phi.AAC.1